MHEIQRTLITVPLNEMDARLAALAAEGWYIDPAEAPRAIIHLARRKSDTSSSVPKHALRG